MFEPKERIEILVGNGINKKKKCRVEQDRIVISEGGKGRGKTAYKPQFTEDCFIYWQERLWYPPFNKVLKRKLMILDGATECIHFTKKGVEIPTFDKKASQKLFEAETIKHAGASTQKVGVPLAVYIILAMSFGVGLINLILFARKIGI